MNAADPQSQAKEWLVKNQTARNLEHHWPDFETWLQADPGHRRLYEAEERHWAALEAIKSVLRDRRLTPETLVRAEHRRRRTKRVARLATVACCIGIFATATLMRPGRNSVEAHPWVTYHRGAEDLTPVSLDDGSVVQLNANSQVRVRLTGTTRQVTLDDGEAYFDVSPSPAKPFDVEAGTIVIRAKGTAFTVRKEGGGIETAVKRGAVEVGSTDPSHTANAAADSPSSQIKAGEVATIGPSGRVSVAQLDPAELADRLAWANPPFYFRGMPLAKAVALFNRYNVHKLEVSGALGETLISGRYRLTEPDKFVESLENLGIARGIEESASLPDAWTLLVPK